MAAALTIRWARSPQARAGEGALTSKKINSQARRSRPRIDLTTAAALRELLNMSLASPQKPPEESQSLFASAWEQRAVSWGTRPAFLSHVEGGFYQLKMRMWKDGRRGRVQLLHSRARLRVRA